MNLWQQLEILRRRVAMLEKALPSQLVRFVWLEERFNVFRGSYQDYRAFVRYDSRAWRWTVNRAGKHAVAGWCKDARLAKTRCQHALRSLAATLDSADGLSSIAANEKSYCKADPES